MPDWEHLFVTACLIPGPDGGQWRPRMVNNNLLPDWEQGPTLASFIQGLEGDGWQLARKVPNTLLDQATTLSFLFKRPRQQLSANDGPTPASTEAGATGPAPADEDADGMAPLELDAM